MDRIAFALKSLFGNKRRAILNLVALFLGMGFMIFVLGWVRGYSEIVYEGIINLDTAHIQIEPKDSGNGLAGNFLDVDPALVRKIKEVDHVTGVSARIETPVEIMAGGEAVYKLIRAMDPNSEAKLTTITRKIVKGSFPGSFGEIALEKGFAEKLKIKVGDEISCLLPGAKNSEAAIRRFTVSGVFETGFDLIDKAMAFAGLDGMREVLGAEGKASRLVVKLDRTSSIDKALEEINKQLPPGLTAVSWKKFAESTVEATTMDSQTGFIMAYIIIFMIFLGILNSFSMSVRERLKDFATWRAIGMRRSGVLRQVALEGVTLALLSCLATAVLAGPGILYLNSVGFDFNAMLPEGLPIVIGSKFTMVTVPGDVIFSALSACVLCVVCSVIPAWGALKRSPAEILSTPDW